MMTNIVAQLIIVISTNWISYEGFKIEYESNIIFNNSTFTANTAINTTPNSTTLQSGYTPYSPKIIRNEQADCPFINQIVASTNSYSRVGEVVKFELYRFDNGKEIEKSRTIIGYVRQEGRKMTKVEWQWDEPKETHK